MVRNRQQMNCPAASCGVWSYAFDRHSVLDTESSLVFWTPAFARMTKLRGMKTTEIQNSVWWMVCSRFCW